MWQTSGQKNLEVYQMAEKFGYKMFEGKCPECGKKVYNIDKNTPAFCSKQCESNYNYRKTRFAGDEKGSKISSDRLRNFKL